LNPSYALALALWLGLIAAAVGVLAAAGALARWQHRRADPSWQLRSRRLTAVDQVRLLDAVDELSRQALAVAAAASRAQSAVAEAWRHCAAAQQDRELAWHEYDTAQRAYLSLLHGTAAAWPFGPSGAWPVRPVPVAGGARAPHEAVALTQAPAVPRAPALPALAPPEALALRDRPELPGAPETPDAPALPAAPLPLALPAVPAPGAPVEGDVRDAARAAFAAYRRGDISVEQLRAVFQRFSGWDGGRERYEHELLRRRAAERAARRRYDAAAAAERRAYHRVDIAAVAARALADEAAQAAEEARLARVFADECLRRSGRRVLRLRA